MVRRLLTLIQLQAVEIALGMVVMIIVNRALGPEGRGIWNAAFLAPLLVSSLGLLAIPDALLFYAASRPDERAQLLWDALYASCLLSALYLVLMIVFMEPIKAITIPSTPTYIYVIAVATVPINMLVASVSIFLFSLGRTADYRIADLAEKAYAVLGGVVVLLVFDWGVPAAILLTASGRLVALLVAVARLPSWARTPRDWRPNHRRLRLLCRYGAGVTVANLAAKLNSQLDQFLVNLLLGPAALGLYATANRLAQPPGMLASHMRIIAFAETASQTEEESSATTMRANRRLLMVQALIVPLYAIACAAAIPFLFGEAFIPSIAPLLILLLAAATVTQSSVFIGALSGSGRPRSLIVPAWVTLIATAVLYPILIQSFGLIGAALASLSAWSLFSLLVYRAWARTAYNHRLRDFLWRRTDIPSRLTNVVALVRAAVPTDSGGRATEQREPHETSRV